MKTAEVPLYSEGEGLNVKRLPVEQRGFVASEPSEAPAACLLLFQSDGLLTGSLTGTHESRRKLKAKASNSCGGLRV